MSRRRALKFHRKTVENHSHGSRRHVHAQAVDHTVSAVALERVDHSHVVPDVLVRHAVGVRIIFSVFIRFSVFVRGDEGPQWAHAELRTRNGLAERSRETKVQEHRTGCARRRNDRRCPSRRTACRRLAAETRSGSKPILLGRVNTVGAPKCDRSQCDIRFLDDPEYTRLCRKTVRKPNAI